MGSHAPHLVLPHLLLLLSLLGWSSWAQDAGPPPPLAWPLKTLPPHLGCKESDMCSMDHVKPWVGDVSPSAGLHAALAARAFKKEIIFIPAGPNAYFVELACRLVQNLQYLGFGHVLLLANSETTCRLFTAILPSIGCAWDGSPWIKHSMDPTWFLRAKMNARVPRLGYNTLMMDADSIMFQDPYRAFNAPGLRDMSFLCMTEAPHGVRACYCNGGFARVQSARPDGATTWIFKEFVERAYKNMDDGYELQRSHGMGLHRDVGLYALMFDQSALHDTMVSALSRRPLYPWLMHSWSLAPGATEQQVLERLSFFEQSKDQANCILGTRRSSGHALPPELQSTLGQQGLDFEYWAMHVPDSGRDHNASVFGPVLVPEVPGGSFSAHFERQLKEDCPGCPWWPDTQGQRTQQHDGSEEFFAVAPEWLIGNAWYRAQPGYWSAPPGFHAPQVMGHVHVLSDLVHVDRSRAMKRAIQSHLGYSPQPMDWDLANTINEKMKEVLAAHDHVPHALRGYSSLRPHTQLLLFNPRLSLRSVRTIRDYQTMAFGLMQLAQLSGRSLVWPSLPCTLPVFPPSRIGAWSMYNSQYPAPSLTAAAGASGPLLDSIPRLSFPYYSQLSQSMLCYPMAGLCEGCLHYDGNSAACQLSALLDNEAAHWVSSRGLPRSLQEQEQVAWLRGWAEQPEAEPAPGPEASDPERGFQGRVALLTEADAMRFLEAHAHRPVLVLDAFVFVDMNGTEGGGTGTGAAPLVGPLPQGEGPPGVGEHRACVQQYASTMAMYSEDWSQPLEAPAVSLDAEHMRGMVPARIDHTATSGVLKQRGER